MTARFITFEGGEGAGKTTQIKQTQIWLEKQDIECVVTREPGGTKEAEMLRDLVVRDNGLDFSPLSQLAILYASRVEHVQKVIKPALANDVWVLCDRFADSSRVYQGIAQKIGLSIVQKLHDTLLDNFEPDITFVLDVPADIGLQRTIGRNTGEDKFEKMDIEFHNTIRKGFLLLAEKNPRMSVIDTTANQDKVQSDIRHVLTGFIAQYDCVKK